MRTETKTDLVINALIAIICLGAMFAFGCYMAHTSEQAFNVFGGVAVMAVALLIGGALLACVIPRRLHASVTRTVRAFVRRNETALTVAKIAVVAVVAVVVSYFGFAVPGAAAAVFPALLVPRSRNKKTGNVPSVWIGSNLQEARASCKGCQHLDNGSCYAQFGSPSFAIASMQKAIGRGVSYDAGRIEETHKNARMLRVGALGDPSRANKRQLKAIIKAAVAQGLSVVGYTHFWKLKRAGWLRGILMASCDNLQEVKQANAAGWKATVVLPAGTTGTIRDEHGKILAVECPAIAADRVGRKYSCNDCASTHRGALCDASKAGPNVYFADHGPKARKLKVIQ